MSPGCRCTPGFEAGWPQLRTTEVRLLLDRHDVLGERGALAQLSKALPRTVHLPDGTVRMVAARRGARALGRGRSASPNRPATAPRWER